MPEVKQNIQPHGRIIIRKRVKEILSDKIDISPTKMFFSRPNPKFAEETPLLLIYFTDEIADHQNIVPRSYKRDLVLVTEVQIQTNATIDHFNNFDGSLNENYEDIYLDSRAYEIENALGSDRFLGLNKLVQDTVLVRTQPIDIVYEGQINVSAMRIFWNISWRDCIANTISLDEFLNFGAKYETTIGAEAEDDVTIREE